MMVMESIVLHAAPKFPISVHSNGLRSVDSEIHMIYKVLYSLNPVYGNTVILKQTTPFKILFHHRVKVIRRTVLICKDFFL